MPRSNEPFGFSLSGALGFHSDSLWTVEIHGATASCGRCDDITALDAMACIFGSGIDENAAWFIAAMGAPAVGDATGATTVGAGDGGEPPPFIMPCICCGLFHKFVSMAFFASVSESAEAVAWFCIAVTCARRPCCAPGASPDNPAPSAEAHGVGMRVGIAALANDPVMPRSASTPGLASAFPRLSRKPLMLHRSRPDTGYAASRARQRKHQRIRRA